MIDPSKDKFAYFKDNIQTAEDKEFDASQYYYHREEMSGSKGPGSSAAAASVAAMGLSSYGMVGGMGGSMGGGMSMSGAMGGMGMSAGMGGAMGGGLGDAGLQPTAFSSGFPGGGMLSGGVGSFLGPALPRAPPLGGMPSGAHELHRMSSTEHLSLMKSRNFPLQPENKAPDMSEFPALSRTNSWALDQTSDTSSTRSQSSEFVIQKEDFPALSPFGNAPSSNDKASMQQPPEHGELKRHSSFHSSVNDSIMASHQTRPTGVAGSNSSIGSRGSGAPGFLPPSSSSVQSSGNASSSLSGTGAFGPLHGTRPGASTANGELDPSNQFGLLGMLHTVIRPSNDAKKNLLMGCDLTSLGLNLNSAEPLYPVFASPWADGPLTKEPQFTLPMCYYNQPPALKTTHLAKFHLETLFYIFYSMPKDVLQAYAAQELYARDWRYHTDLKMWLKRATPADAALFANGSGSGGLLSPSAPSGSLGLGGAGGIGSIGSIGSASSASSSSAGLGSLGPQFLFFDTTTWERRVFTGNIHSLSAGLLSEEDIRVKFTASS